MTSTNRPSEAATSPGVPRPSGAPGSVPIGDPLAEIDAIVDEVVRRDHQTAQQAANARDEMEKFTSAFKAACQAHIRPAMEAVIERLRQRGGGGIIEEHPGGEARYRYPCIILWMSLQGDIMGEPRPDREPYMQLEADVASREVQVSEGDMWLGAGGHHSGRTDKWQLSDLTQARIIEELVAIARRAVPPL